MKNALTFLLITFSLLSASAQKGSSSGSKKILSTGIMLLNSKTTQGGVGPTGSSLLSRTEFVWAYKHVGYGAMFDYDLHGSNEKDSAYGIKLEAYLSKFYVELGYLIAAKRAYTDRAIAEETGTGIVYGFGARFPFSNNSGKGFFFHASYKFKTQTFTKQDGVDISEPIIQTDGYPLLGFGWAF